MSVSDFTFEIIAQTLAAEPPWTNLVNFGIAGIVIGWFMWRDDKKAKSDERQHGENIKTLNALSLGMQKSIVAQMIAIETIKLLDASGIKEMARAVKLEAEAEINRK